MSSSYIQWPPTGVPIYSSISAFPATAPEGSLGVARDTGILYEFFGGSWVVLDAPGLGGTVTSVGLALPVEFTVSGSPVTTAGTLTGTWATQAANIVFAGPTTGSAATPAFRALVAADLPAGTGTVTSVALALPGIFTVSGSPVTTTGTLTGTLATQTANTFFAGATSGGAATPAFRAIVAGDLPAGTGTVTSVAMTVPSFLSISGSPITTTGTLALTLSGTALPVANGGTGQTTATAAFDALAPTQTSNSGKFLTTNGTTTSWATVTASVTGPGSSTNTAIPTWNGTGGTALNDSDFLYASGTLNRQDNATVNATAAPSLTIRAANKTGAAGTSGKGGDLTLVAGGATGAGSTGDGGDLILRAGTSNNNAGVIQLQRFDSNATYTWKLGNVATGQQQLIAPVIAGVGVPFTTATNAAYGAGYDSTIGGFGLKSSATSSSLALRISDGIFYINSSNLLPFQGTETIGSAVSPFPNMFSTNLIAGGAATDGLVRAQDNSTANATVAPALTVRAANKTAGTGAGGALNLAAGTSAGGTAGIINQSTAGIVRTSVSSTGKTTTQIGGTSSLGGQGGVTTFLSTATVGNTAATQTDAYSHTVAANTLSVDGDSIEFQATGTFAATASVDKRITVSYGGTTIIDTGPLAINGGLWTMQGTVIRTGASAQKVFITFWTNTTLYFPTYVGYLVTSFANSSGQTLKLTLNGTLANDVTAEACKEVWQPA